MDYTYSTSAATCYNVCSFIWSKQTDAGIIFPTFMQYEITARDYIFTLKLRLLLICSNTYFKMCAKRMLSRAHNITSNRFHECLIYHIRTFFFPRLSCLIWIMESQTIMFTEIFVTETESGQKWGVKLGESVLFVPSGNIVYLTIFDYLNDNVSDKVQSDLINLGFLCWAFIVF